MSRLTHRAMLLLAFPYFLFLCAIYGVISAWDEIRLGSRMWWAEMMAGGPVEEDDDDAA